MNENIGERIRELRKRKGISQERLHNLTGIAKITIQGYESGKFKPKIEQVQRIATALGVSPAEIVGATYWDKTVDTGQLSKESAALDSVSDIYGEDAVQLLGQFSELNEQGKRKATEYITDLTEQPKYRK